MEDVFVIFTFVLRWSVEMKFKWDCVQRTGCSRDHDHAYPVVCNLTKLE